MALPGPQRKAAIDGAPFAPLGDGAATGTVFRCALCGTRFTHGGRTCGSCPLAAGCELISCPRCGHGFPRRSVLAEWLRRLVGRARRDRR
jgi:hypothetical protein